jgi:glutathione S-transferase
MTIKLYADPGSGSVRRVTTAARIMGIELEEIYIDLFNGESHTSEHLARNPHGLVPVLVDGDTVLYEASAINIYLAEKSGSGLLPKLGRERYEVLQWMFWSGEQWRINSSTLFAERIGKRA